MPIYQDIEAHIIEAMRSQEKARLMALRNIKAFLKNKSIELKKEITDAEATQFLATLAKQRRESIEAFGQAGRDELVAKEQAELAVIQEYLPKALTSEELDTLIQEVITEVGASGPKEMGLVMKTLKPKVTGRAEGKTVSERVKALLSA